MSASDPNLSWLFEGLRAEPWGLLPLANLSGKSTGGTSIKEYRQICSYNWLDDPEHQTMVIPGAPPELINWNGGKLQPDVGELMYYENHIRYPWAPMDPMFHAIKICGEKGMLKEPVDFQEFDLITDAINLQKIFAFCKGDSEGLFRIDLERIGDTIVATRAEGADQILIDFNTFDLGVKQHCTQNYFAGPKQTSYYQIVRYQFGSLKLLVRFDPDAADYTKYDAAAKWTEDGQPPVRPVIDPQTRVPIADSLLHYVPAGEIKQYSLLTSTSFPQGKGFPFYTWGQLFFTGMENLLVGWWKGTGDFLKPSRVTLADINKIIKPLPYTALAKVHDLLGKITRFTKQCHPNARITLLWRGSDNIEIYERSADIQVGITEPIRQYLMSQVAAEKLAEYLSAAAIINEEIIAEQQAEVTAVAEVDEKDKSELEVIQETPDPTEEETKPEETQPEETKPEETHQQE